MALFTIKDKIQLEIIKKDDFKLEKDIQKLTENNLELIFSLDFVKTEFSLNGFRIDTLAFDKSTNSFVVIEYKRDKNFSVIDQGYAYLSLMLNNKADFILEYNESQQQTLRRDDIDWSQSKVIFISPSFTTYQREAINFKNLPIELWEIKRYANQTVDFKKIQSSTKSQESIKTISKSDETIEKIEKEIKIYTEQEHLEIATQTIKELYEKLRNEILALDNIELQPKKHYIAFVGASNILDMNIQKNAIKIWLNLKYGELEDIKSIARNVSSIGHLGNGDYEVALKKEEEIDYLLTLIKQSLQKNKK